jgi:aminoglycoside phosphotransferase (APT) family kinase protein
MKKDIHYPVAHRSQAMIDSFKTRYDDFDVSIIADIVHDSIGIRPISVEQSRSWGSAHVIFYLKFKDHRDLVFRANINIKQPEVEMIIEKLVTELAQKQGVPTNTILHVDISRKKYDLDFTIQERLGGIDPEDEFAGTADDYDTFTFETGQAIAKLGQIKLDGFGRFNEERAIKEGVLVGTKETVTDYIDVCLAEDIDALIEYKVITAKQAKDVLSFFEQRKNIMNIKQGSLVHYDLADHNLRYSNGHLDAIFDWETAIVASPVLDLASCPTWKSHYPKRAKLLEGFMSIQQLPDNFEEMEKVYLLRTMLWKMRYAIRANILDRARAQKFKDTLCLVGVL